MAQIKAVKKTAKTEDAWVMLSPRQILELKFFMSGLTMGNKDFTETVAWWHTKNEKKLQAAYMKALAADKEMDLQWVEKGRDGMLRLWDGIEAWPLTKLREELNLARIKDVPEDPGEKEKHFKNIEDMEREIAVQEAAGTPETWGRPIGFTCLLKELPDGKTQFIDEVSGDVLPDMEKEMFFYIADPEKRKEYTKLKEEFSSVPAKVKVVKINRDLLEKLVIPTMGSTGQGSLPKKLNRELFYETLVIGEDEDEDNEE